MPFKHPLQQIREVLKISADHLGHVVGLKPDTIREIEKGRRALTEENARRINAATGVSLRWLLNDGKGPLVNFMGKAFTRDWHGRWIEKLHLIDGHFGIPTCINENEIVDAVALIQKLKSTFPDDLFSQNLSAQLARGLAKRIAHYEGGDNTELTRDLATELTIIIRKADLCEPRLLKRLTLTHETKEALASPQKREGAWLARLNRLVLEDAYPGIIKRHLRAIDKAEQLAAEIGEFARLICISATRAQQPKLLPFYRASIQALYEIRDSFNLRDAYWKEWESAHVKQAPSNMTIRNTSLLWMWDPDGAKRLLDIPDPRQGIFAQPRSAVGPGSSKKAAGKKRPPRK